MNKACLVGLPRGDLGWWHKQPAVWGLLMRGKVYIITKCRLIALRGLHLPREFLGRGNLTVLVQRLYQLA